MEERLRKALAMERDPDTYYAFHDTAITAKHHARTMGAQNDTKKDRHNEGDLRQDVSRDTESVVISEKMDIPADIDRT